jgi:nicotinate-nucleotide adenylyltransferase
MNLKAVPESILPPTLKGCLKIPAAGDGQRIGLLGGSFNPPHDGHRKISLQALGRAGLDCIWWLVTPGNPLKDQSELEGLERRVRQCEAVASHPAIKVTAFEAAHRVRFTEDTLAILAERRPKLRFVWIMGADNLSGFHHWQNWQRIAGMMPILVVDRPGSTYSTLSAPAAIALGRYRIPEHALLRLPDAHPPAWAFLHGPRSGISSTAIRAARRAKRA